MKFVIEHLKKRYEKKEVLQDIDFTFETGKIYGLLGRNGAGKTTLFNCLNGDDLHGAVAGPCLWWAGFGLGHSYAGIGCLDAGLFAGRPYGCAPNRFL